MGRCFLHGNGGANPLNFKVVGNPQPTNPKENTIWLNTDTKITGYYFQQEQPENMQPGEVWIGIGGSSQVAFNALKKGGTVMVYPIRAKQMVSDALVDVESKIWQNGAWSNWFNGVLYNAGDTCDDATGGYATKAMPAASWDTNGGANPSITYGSTSMTIKASVNVRGGIVYTKNKIDLRGYNTLRFTGKLYTGELANNWRTSLRIWSSLGANSEANNVAALLANNTYGTRSIDISKLNSEDGYYIGFFVYTNEVCVTMEKMWLE